MRRLFCLTLSLAWLAACGGGEPPAEAEVEGPNRADSVAMAAASYDASVFDTISWDEQPMSAVERGSLVYRISCAKCHGEVGRGNGDFVYQGDTLQPPSFLAEDWRFAGDPDGLREYIFTGNVVGMPYWGLVGLQYRDIDAVSRFITDFLRENYSLSE